MLLAAAIVAVAALADGAVLLQDPNYHPCVKPAATSIQPSLMACATKQAYCLKAQGRSVTFTQTNVAVTQVPKYISTRSLASTTSTTTVTAYSTTVTTTPVVYTDYVFDTYTTTQYHTACPVGGGKQKRAFPTNPGGCGIPKNIDPTVVSAACDCVLASKTTVTLTQTTLAISTSFTTKLTTTTTTTASTSTTTSTARNFVRATQTACAIGWHVQAVDSTVQGRHLRGYDNAYTGGATTYFLTDLANDGLDYGSDTRLIMYLEASTGYLRTVSGNAVFRTYQGEPILSGVNMLYGTPLTCSMDAAQRISCGGVRWALDPPQDGSSQYGLKYETSSGIPAPKEIVNIAVQEVEYHD